MVIGNGVSRPERRRVCLKMEVGGDATFVRMDASQSANVQGLFAEIVQCYGQLALHL